MAIQIDTAGTGLARTTGTFLAPAGDFSFMYWVTNLSTTLGKTFSMLGDDTFTANYVWVGSDSGSGEQYALDTQGPITDVNFTTPQNYSIPTIWTHVAVTYDGTTHVFSFYMNGSLFTTITNNLSASTFAMEHLGTDSLEPPAHLGIGYYRSWAAKLTATEIKTEMASSVAVKATPFCDTPLTSPSDLADVSGNSRHWTAVGTLASLTGPVLDVALNNLTSGTAHDLGTLPATIVQNVRSGSTTNTVWYQYTAVADETVVGIFAAGYLSGYAPTLGVYTNPAGATYLAMVSVNKPVQVPVDVGVTYYFKVNTNSPAANPAVLIFSGLTGPSSPVSDGDLAINDDGDGFPIAFIRQTTAVPLAYRSPFPAGENANILPSGVLCVNGIGAIGGVGVFVYNAGLTRIYTLTTDPLYLGPITSDQDDTFYFSQPGAAAVHGIVKAANATTGVVSGTSYDFGAGVDIQGLAVSLTNSILYYHAGGAVKRWDIATNLALSDFVAAVANYTTHRDLIVLADGTICIQYRRASNNDYYIRRYNAAAVLQSTYSFGLVATNNDNRLCLAINNPTSFWAWIRVVGTSGADNRFVNIKVSDGSLTTDISDLQYEKGICFADQRIDPIARFGVSESCPFWVTRSTPTPPLPTYHTVEQVIRRQRRSPHILSNGARVFIHALQLDLEPGIGLTTGQGEDALIMLRLSYDGGHTYGEEQVISAGRAGEYVHRAMWRRLGSARDLVVEITVSDPCAYRLLNLWVDAESGNY